MWALVALGSVNAATVTDFSAVGVVTGILGPNCNGNCSYTGAIDGYEAKILGGEFGVTKEVTATYTIEDLPPGTYRISLDFERSINTGASLTSAASKITVNGIDVRDEVIPEGGEFSTLTGSIVDHEFTITVQQGISIDAYSLLTGFFGSTGDPEVTTKIKNISYAEVKQNGDTCSADGDCNSGSCALGSDRIANYCAQSTKECGQSGGVGYDDGEMDNNAVCQSNGSWLCDAGYYWTGTLCDQVDGGYYSAANSDANNQCQAGTYCPVGSDSEVTCPTGTSLAGSDEVTDCNRAPLNPSQVTVSLLHTATPNIAVRYNDEDEGDTGDIEISIYESNLACGSPSSETYTLASSSNNEMLSTAMAIKGDGTYWYCVRANDNNEVVSTSDWVNGSFEVSINYPPTIPTVVSPADNTEINSPSVDLEVIYNDANAGSQGTVTFAYYDSEPVECGVSGSPTEVEISSITEGSGAVASIGSLNAGQTYFWCAKGQDIYFEESNWTAARSFDVAICGDNQAHFSEVCDGSDMNGTTCEDVGFAAGQYVGQPSCSTCTLTTGSCQQDADGDGIADSADNCPSDVNPGQEDEDGDQVGDVCDTQNAEISDTIRGYMSANLDVVKGVGTTDVFGQPEAKGVAITSKTRNVYAKGCYVEGKEAIIKIKDKGVQANVDCTNEGIAITEATGDVYLELSTDKKADIKVNAGSGMGYVVQGQENSWIIEGLGSSQSHQVIVSPGEVDSFDITFIQSGSIEIYESFDGTQGVIARSGQVRVIDSLEEEIVINGDVASFDEGVVLLVGGEFGMLAAQQFVDGSYPDLDGDDATDNNDICPSVAGDGLTERCGLASAVKDMPIIEETSYGKNLIKAIKDNGHDMVLQPGEDKLANYLREIVKQATTSTEVQAVADTVNAMLDLTGNDQLQTSQVNSLYEVLGAVRKWKFNNAL